MSKTLSSILQKGVISVARGGTGTTTSTGTGSVVLSTSPAISTSLTTPSASFNLINTNATTVNFAGAATSIVIGASLPGLTKINHDLQVEGNIFFNGTANQLSATNLSVNDALIYLAANNTADLLDIGLIGRYNNGVDDDTHAGLVRDATDSVWKLFSNVTDEPTTTVDFSNATYDTLQIGNLLTSKVNKVTITAPSTSATLTLANSSSLITTGNSLTLTTTADTNVTFPTTGTLVNSDVTTLSLLSSVGTITSGIWSSDITTTVDASIHTLTVGLGNSNVASNTIVGYQGLAAITTGAENTAVGYQSLKVTTVGADNTAIGYHTLLANVTGSNNVAVGGYALLNSTNNDNVAIGFQTLKSTTIGAGNTALGYYAGYANSANANTTGSNNTYVGYNTVGSSATNSNEIVIGATAVGLGSNTTVIGNSSTTSSKIFGTLTAANGLIVNTTLTVPSGDTLSRPSAVAGNLRFNTTTASFEGYNGSAWGSIGSGGGGSGLTPTPIKIEDGYTASANDLVRCNTTAGSFSVLLPASPNDGDMIGFMDVAETFDIHYVSVLPNGKTIENDGTAMLLNIRGTYIVFGYIQITGNWKMLDMQAVVSAAPMASTSVLGIVKVDGTTITINGSGVISGANTYSLTAATTSALGGVIIPSVGTSGLSNISGTIGLATASTTQLGGVKVDGTTITINGSGVISGANTYSLTAATTSALGGVIIPAVATSSITNTSGTIGLATASTTQLGGVKVDGTTITINGSGVISSAGGLKSTPIKIAEYTALAYDLVRCNTTDGAFSVIFPASPVDGDIIGIIDTNNTFETSHLTVIPNTGKTVEGDSTSMILDVNGSYMAFVYISATSNWKMLETPVTVGVGGGIATGASYTNPTATGTSAAAFGSGASAGGSSSLALGKSASASGGSSIAIGENTLASGTYALALGAATSAVDRTTAIGMNSGASPSITATSAGAMALGGSYASGTDSFAAAIGNNTSTYGAQNTSAIAMGQNCKSTGLYGSTAIGVSCIAGIGAIAMGFQSTATGDSSICISNNGSVATSAWSGVFGGGYNTSSGQFSTVLGGASNQATANYSTVIGGNRGNAQQIGKVVFGCAWYTGEIGHAQNGKIVIGAETTTTTAVALTSDGGAASTTNQLIVATNQAITFFGTLIAKQSASANMASYMIKGAIVNNGGTVSVSTISIETLVDTIGLDTVPTFTADNTNKALAVTSGYKAATTIRWVCNLDSVEVTRA